MLSYSTNLVHKPFTVFLFVLFPFESILLIYCCHLLGTWISLPNVVVLRCHGNDDRLLGRYDMVWSGFSPGLVLRLDSLGLGLPGIRVCTRLSVDQHRGRAGRLGRQDRSDSDVP